jgi:hypothetical protein
LIFQKHIVCKNVNDIENYSPKTKQPAELTPEADENGNETILRTHKKQFHKIDSCSEIAGKFGFCHVFKASGLFHLILLLLLLLLLLSQ